MTELEQDLAAVLNKHSCENNSGTPDSILAQYLTFCLAAFNQAIQQRKTWYSPTSVVDWPGDASVTYIEMGRAG